jgi:uncharacterized protein (DUF1697 family)
MAVIISMLRAVNLGPHNRVKMDALRAIFESLKLQDPETYVQSGNVVFKTTERDLVLLAKKIETAVSRKLSCRTNVILRNPAELRAVIARNPFAKRRGIEPNKLLVTFLASDPGKEARDKVLKINIDPEEVWIEGREIYIYYPNGMARPKIPWTMIERTLEVSGTARNWNTVTKLLEIAEKLEASDSSSAGLENIFPCA